MTDGVIVRPRHGSEFAIADGSVATGPATAPLPGKSVSVEAGSIVLARPPRPGCGPHLDPHR